MLASDTSTKYSLNAYKPQRQVASSPTLGAREFIRSVAAIFRLAHKSDRSEFTLYLKLVALGILIVGAIGFIIKLVGNIFFG